MPESLDLHTHSLHSDGRLSTHALADRLASRRVSLAALSDHDTLDGTAPFRRACRRLGVATVPAVEISSLWQIGGREKELHLLAYDLPEKHPDIESFLAGIRRERRIRFLKMHEKLLAGGVRLPEEEVLAAADRGNPGRPHLAELLIRHGQVRDIEQAFGRWLGDEGAAWMPKVAPPGEEVIRRVREWGGVLVLAHPGKSLAPAQWQLPIEAGIDGLECIHPSHGSAARRELLALCRRNGLSATGGSDYHGIPEKGAYREPGWELSRVGGPLEERLRQRLKMAG